jgi:hypothetical protein
MSDPSDQYAEAILVLFEHNHSIEEIGRFLLNSNRTTDARAYTYTQELIRKGMETRAKRK